MLLVDSLTQIAIDTTNMKDVIVNVADTVTNFVYIKEVPVSDGYSADTIWNIIGVCVTLFAVLVALFGNEYINWLKRIDLDIININKIFFEPEKISNFQINNYFKIYLKVKNKKGKKIVKNAKVRLLRIAENNNNELYIHELTKEAQFKWYTLEKDSFENSFLDSQLFYFGFLAENSEKWKFIPLYYTKEQYLGNNVNPNQTKIYELEILSDNYIAKRKFYFQVYFDGIVNYDIKKMKNHIQITKVNGIDDFREPIKYDD